jgi:hypothetical protein
MGEAAYAKELAQIRELKRPSLELLTDSSERADPSGIVPIQNPEEGLQSYVREIKPRFSIEELPDRYRLRNIYHNRRLSDVEWGKERLDDGKKHDYHTWLRLTHDKDLKPVDSRVLGSVASALYDNRDAIGEQGELIEKMRATIADQFTPEPTENYPLMNAKIYTKQSIYSKGDTNKVSFSVHEGCSTYDCHAVESKHVHTDRIKKGYHPHFGVLLGIEEIKQIKEIFGWLAGKENIGIRMRGSLHNTNGISHSLAVGLGEKSLEIDTEGSFSDRRPAIGAKLRYK